MDKESTIIAYKRTVFDSMWRILKLEQSCSTTTVLVFPNNLAAISPVSLQRHDALQIDGLRSRQMRGAGSGYRVEISVWPREIR